MELGIRLNYGKTSEFRRVLNPHPPRHAAGYTLATTRRGDHQVHGGHVVALGNNNIFRKVHMK
jgi:hypothetical protein